MPKVSVVIPVFNGERFIGDAIESVLDQTFRDFEIIVVNDGSTDGTEKIVRQFRVPISYHYQQNQGAGVARNLGISLAQGEWIAFLDADDIWRQDKLAVQIEHIETHPEVAFFYSEMDVIDEGGNVTEAGFLSAKDQRRKEKGRTNLVSVVFDNRPFPYPSTVLVRKDVFLQAGKFNPLFRGNYHEDFELFARVAQISSIHFIPQSLVKYRVNSSQDSNVVSVRNENWLILLKCLREMWRDEPEKQAILEYYFVKHYSDQGKRFLRAGDYQKARQYFRQVFSCQPLYWRNLCRWGLSYLPGLREFYVYHKTKDRRSHIRKDGDFLSKL